MKISSKGRYAVRIMAELSKHDNKIVSVAELSQKQGITEKYLEKIISQLVKNNLVESVRGTNGGYKLKKDAKKYTVAEILQATGDLGPIAPCLAKGVTCPRKNQCDSVECWENLTTLINNYLSNVSLYDLIDKNKKV